MKNLHLHFLACVVGFLNILQFTYCTVTQAKVATDVGIKIADDTCKEVQDTTKTPEWVNLLCGEVKVLMPADQWHAIRARKSTVDAGPGK